MSSTEQGENRVEEAKSEQTRLAFTDKERQDRKLEKARYEKLKEEILELEKTNLNKLYCFDCGKGWFKLAGHSMLIYYYDIAKKILNQKPNLQPDTDYTKTIFEMGTISFRGSEGLEKKLVKAGVLKSKREGKYVVVFELNFALRQSEIRELIKEMKFDQERALTILRPAVILEPKIYEILRHINKRLFESVRKVSEFERNYNGLLMAEYGRKMLKYYMMFNKGMILEPEVWKKILETSKLLVMEVSLATELKMWRQDVGVSIGAELVELQRETTKKLTGKTVPKQVGQIAREVVR